MPGLERPRAGHRLWSMRRASGRGKPGRARPRRVRFWSNQGRRMGFDIKSAGLTDFDGCSFRPFSSRTAAEHPHGKEPSTVLAETFAPKGLAMLIRSKMYGVGDGAACA